MIGVSLPVELNLSGLLANEIDDMGYVISEIDFRGFPITVHSVLQVHNSPPME